MIYYTVRFYFGNTWLRWMIAFCLLVAVGLILKYIGVSAFLPKGARLTFWDYIFSSMSNLFTMVLVLPLTFCYLIGDAVTKDYQAGYVEFFLTRLPSRIQYFLSKIVIIMIASSSLFVIYFASLLVNALLFRLPLHGPYFFEVVRSGAANGQSFLLLMIIQMALFILFYQALGIFLMALSVLCNHFIFSYIGLVVLIIQGHDATFNQHAHLFFTPLAQGILSLHTPYYFYGINPHTNIALRSFTVPYSVSCLFIASILWAGLSWLKLRKENLGQRS